MINSSQNTAAKRYHINSNVARNLLLAPFILTGFFFLLLAFPATRSLGLELLKENNVVELATFVILLVASVKGLSLAYQVRHLGQSVFARVFYILFSLTLLVIAMEEISWGQMLLDFPTPEHWRAINVQGEFNLHNLQGLGGHTEFLRIAFGLGALAGVALGARGYLPEIAAPALLLPWFVFIVLFTIPDIYNDYFPSPLALKAFNRLSELVELMIAISSFYYLWLNGKKLAAASS